MKKMKNREIKFRAWDKENKEMYDVQNLFLNRNGGLEGIHYWPPPGYSAAIVRSVFKGKENLVLMQYTGLTDKNGKEIFEGDIVQNKSLSMKGEIRLDTFSNSLGKYHGWCIFRKMKIGDDKISTWESPHWVVIGNICENPELLK